MARTTQAFIVVMCVWLTAPAAEGMVTGRRDRSIIVPCNKLTMLPQQEVLQIRWMRASDLLVQWKSDSGTYYPPSADQTRFVIDISFNLQINRAEFSDSGPYTCEFEFKEGNGTIFTNETKDVLVWDIPSRPPGEPQLVALDPTSMNVTWQASEYMHNSNITHYMVQLSDKEGKTRDELVKVPGPLTVVVKGLQPYTQYQARVMAVNGVGDSEPSNPSQYVHTQEAVPSMHPTIVSVTALSDREIEIVFEPPPTGINGVLRGFVVMYQLASATGSMHAWEIMNSTFRRYVFGELRPYTAYTVAVRVVNSLGEGPADSKTVVTHEGKPEPPVIYQVTSQSPNRLSVLWAKPKEFNGEPMGYVLYLKKNGTIVQNISIPEEIAQDMMQYHVVDLKPYTRYVIQVSARNGRHEGPPSEPPNPGTTDVAAPSEPLGVNCTANSSDTLIVTWHKPSTVYRRIDGYFIQFRKTDEEMWFEMKMLEDEIDPKVNMTKYVLAGLDTNTIYEVAVAGGTKSIYTAHYQKGPYSKPVTYELKGEPKENTGVHGNINHAGLIAGITLAILLLLVIVSVVIVIKYYRRYYKASNYFVPADGGAAEVLLQPSLYQEAYDENDACCVPVASFPKHVQTQHADGDAGFAQEYEEIGGGLKQEFTMAHSTDPDNRHKNRYINIMAYDHSRVILKPVLGRQKHSDYINANYVDGYHKPRSYIATQGPLPHTYNDFWRMVWEQNSYVIIMITNLTERGRIKCDQYWPEDVAETYGFLQVRPLNTYVLAHFTVRLFTLRNTKKKKVPTATLR